MSTPFCFAIACDLKEDVPEQVLETLKYMTRTRDYEFDNPPNAPFFEDEHWRDFFLHIGEGFYFPGEAGSWLRQVYRYTRPVSQGGGDVFLYTFSLRYSGKDDSITTCFEFLDWLAPYSATQGFVGYWIYEYGLNPWILYIQDGQVNISDRPFPAPKPLRG